MNPREKFYVIVGVVLMVAGLSWFSISSLMNGADDNTDDGLRCILAELSSHRINSYDADRDDATAHGQPFNVPRPPPEMSSELIDACERFMAE